MRPIPRTHRHKMLPFSGFPKGERHGGDEGKVNLLVVPVKQPAPVTHWKALSSSHQAHQIISLNPSLLKKHGCGRAPIQVCSEGHIRLVPQGGLADFPNAILNTKRLDLFNLYREVVSRGGFHSGNGINWKGQVFSKTCNHTLTNRMTDYAKMDSLEYVCPHCSISNPKKKPQKTMNGY